MRFLPFLVLGLLLFAAVSSRAADKNPVVVIETSLGSMKLELYPDKAPITVKNFLDYADDKFFDGTIFHRVIKDFMIQGGGFEPNLNQKRTKSAIKNEASNGLSNARGTIAMARTGEPDSATSQFFINTKDNTFLDQARARDGVGYCVFGKVIDGMDVLDKIASARTANRGRGFENAPVEPVTIKSVRRAEG